MPDLSSNSPSPQAQSRPRKKTWTQRVRRAVLVYAVVPYLAILVLMTIFQRDLMYHTSREDGLAAETFGDVGYGHLEDIHIRTHDGLTLNGWILHTEDPGANPDDHYVVVSFPGNAGNRGDRAYDCAEFAEQGFDVVLVDYRGYGDNPGSPNEDDILADAWSVWTCLTTERKISPGRIILFGESLGGGVAVQLAARACRNHQTPAGLVVSSTFSSMTDAAQSNYPFLPVSLLILDRYSSDVQIPDVDCPIVILHGTVDSIIPFELGRKLFKTAPDRSRSGIPKRFVKLPGYNHNNVPRTLLADQLTALKSQIKR